MKARQQAGEGFQPVPEGAHVGVITGLVDLGKQPGYQPQIKDAFKVAVIVTFPDVEPYNGEPMTVTKIYTSSMFKQAILRQHIESLYGKAFPSQESADDFDITKLLGKAGLFNVVHKISNGKTFANISGVMPLPKGMPVPSVDPATFIVYDDTAAGPERAEAFARVPGFLQKKIENQIYDAPGESAGSDDDGDDVPFE